jgi:hypothetical protein
VKGGEEVAYALKIDACKGFRSVSHIVTHNFSGTPSTPVFKVVIIWPPQVLFSTTGTNISIMATSHLKTKVEAFPDIYFTYTSDSGQLLT